MASWNAAVRVKIAWLIGGCRGLAAVGGVGEIVEFVCSLMLFRDTFRLRTWFVEDMSRLGAWFVGVLQVKHPYCKQGEFLVHVF